MLNFIILCDKMEIVDFIPSLIPKDEILQDGKTNKLLKYREFNELAKDERAIGTFYNHQLLPSRLFALDISDFLFAKVPMGGGKTIEGILTIFFGRNDHPYKQRRGLILAPNHTILSIFKQEIKNWLGDIYFNREGNFTSHAMRIDFEFQTIGSYMNYFFDVGSKDKPKKTKEEKEEHMKKVIEENSGRYIIFDEAHYAKESSEGEKAIYTRINEFMHLLKGKGVKWLFLSGTFMINEVKDFISLANLGRSGNDIIPYDILNHSNYEEKLRKYLSRNILYLDEEPLNVKVTYERAQDNDPDEIKIKINGEKVKYTPFLVKLYGYQEKKYDEAREELDKNGAFEIYERTLSIITYPPIPKLDRDNLTYVEDKTDRLGGPEFDFLFNKKDKDNTPMYSVHLWKVKKDEYGINTNYEFSNNPKDKDLVSFKNIVDDNLVSISAKFDKIYDDIMNGTPNEVIVIYTFFIYNGSYPLAEILKLKGIEEWLPKKRYYSVPKDKTKEDRYKTGNVKMPSSKKLRFVVLEGRPLRVNTLLNAINHKENRYGEYIKIVILTRAFAFGPNIFTGRVFYVLGPEWSKAILMQILARALRGRESHKVFDKDEEKYLKIKLMTAFTDSDIEDDKIQPLDIVEAKMYLNAEYKDIEISLMNSILRKISIDAGITNQKDSFKQPKEIDDSNYYLYYFKYKIDEVKDEMKKIMRFHPILYLESLQEMLPKYTRKDLIYTISDMIKNRDQMVDNNGRNCFLNENAGILFLSHNNPNEDLYASQRYYYKLNKKISEYSMKVIAIDETDELLNEIKNDPNRMYEEIDHISASLIFEKFYNEKGEYPKFIEYFMKTYSGFSYYKKGKRIHTILSKDNTQNAQGSLLLPNNTFFRIFSYGTKKWEDLKGNKELTEAINGENMANYADFGYGSKKSKLYIGLITTRNIFKVIVFTGEELIENNGQGISASKNPRGKNMDSFDFPGKDTGKIKIADIFAYYKEKVPRDSNDNIFNIHLRKLFEKHNVIIYR